MTRAGSVMSSLEGFLVNNTTVTALELEMYHFKTTGQKTMSAARNIRSAKDELVHANGVWEKSSNGRRYMRYNRI